MSNVPKSTFEKLSWQDVRKDVEKLNPIFCHIVDQLNPGPEYAIFKATYPYGSRMLKGGRLYIPDSSGTLKSLFDPSIDKHIQEQLGYNTATNPVSMLLKNSTEIFLILEEHTIPLYGLIKPGRIFSTWRVLNQTGSHSPAFIWDMTAGARSIFLLPKITETAGYNRLRRAFHLQNEKPKSMLDHWNIFREIANHASFGEPWETTILFFSKKWFERLDDEAWLKFSNYLYKHGFQGSEFFRNQFTWDTVFSLIQKERGIKPNPYIADTVHHLLAMGIGAMPGFVPATDNSAGPVSKLQEIISTIYQLDMYAPIMMQPHIFSLDKPQPVYYPLRYPTTIKFSPRSRKDSTKIFELFETMSLLSKYQMDIKKDKYHLEGTPLYDTIDKVQYDAFHTEVGTYKGIRLSKDIIDEDPAFSHLIDENKAFSANSTFFKGCIRITSKSEA